MKDVRFLFLGKTYKAFVDVSPKDNPHHYWIFFEDPDLCEELGHCIAFTRKYGSELLLATTGLHQYQGLIRAIKGAMEQFIHSDPISRHPGA